MNTNTDNQPATKGDIREIVTEVMLLLQSYKEESDMKIEKLREEIKGVKEDIVQFKDDILHEIIDLRYVNALKD